VSRNSIIDGSHLELDPLSMLAGFTDIDMSPSFVHPSMYVHPRTTLRTRDEQCVWLRREEPGRNKNRG